MTEAGHTQRMFEECIQNRSFERPLPIDDIPPVNNFKVIGLGSVKTVFFVIVVGWGLCGIKYNFQKLWTSKKAHFHFSIGVRFGADLL